MIPFEHGPISLMFGCDLLYDLIGLIGRHVPSSLAHHLVSMSSLSLANYHHMCKKTLLSGRRMYIDFLDLL